MGKRLPPVRWVFGIDGGNDSSGLGLWDLRSGEPRFAGSWTLCPWDYEFPLTAAEHQQARTVVYAEVPQHGAHSSRGGVHWATGMIARALVERCDIRRRDVKKVKPDEWREVYGEGAWVPGDGKILALAAHKRLTGEEAQSDDEAEGTLIGLYGARIVLEMPVGGL